MLKLKDETVVKFNDWLKKNCEIEERSYEETIHNDELLLKDAQRVIEFNKIDTGALDAQNAKASLTKSLHDFVDTFMESEDARILLMKYSYEYSERYMTYDFFHDVFR
ncbi:MAG: hypothetical protein LUG46_09315, partial [Erysipelotrichaceae bacterium]|nr:hypothetical protein [Erysipelotrichaceae bacterium]